MHIHQAAGSVNRPQGSSRHTIKRPVAPAKEIANRTCAAKRPSIASNNAYLFGAICPARGVGAALALPYADTDMMQLHLNEISSNIAKGAHAVVLLDRAGWHITSKLDMPENITPILNLRGPRS